MMITRPAFTRILSWPLQSNRRKLYGILCFAADLARARMAKPPRLLPNSSFFSDSDRNSSSANTRYPSAYSQPIETERYFMNSGSRSSRRISAGLSTGCPFRGLACKVLCRFLNKKSSVSFPASPPFFCSVPSNFFALSRRQAGSPRPAAHFAQGHGGQLPAFLILGAGTSSAISPVAILAIMTARAFTSAGRFSPFGPRGILLQPYICLTLSISHLNAAGK